jgi:ERCC4-related helicase
VHVIGLGKTFIAAVVMYNFYRWFPQGKVIFMAPTKPLVHQQIDSCYKVMGIPREDTAELTGDFQFTVFIPCIILTLAMNSQQVHIK